MKRSRLAIWRQTGGRPSETVILVEARATCRGANHEEEEAQEGQIGEQAETLHCFLRIDSHADQSPEDEIKAPYRRS